MVRELNFTLEGVQGDLKLEYGPFKQRLYHTSARTPILKLRG